MAKSSRPLIMLLDGDYYHSLRIGEELKRCLDIDILGIGSRPTSCLLRSSYPSVRDIASEVNMDEYAQELLGLVDKHRPDFVLPVGTRSVVALDLIRDGLPEKLYSIPSSDVLHTCFDKASVLHAAKRIGIDVPGDHTEFVHSLDERGRPDKGLRKIALPVFLKASREAGRNLIARIDSYDMFWPTYDELKQQTEDGLILVQEYVDGDPATFAYGFLFYDGKAELAFGHEELRSVPRLGGSGTRVRAYENDKLRSDSERLLSELHYNGVALVEYKKHRDGSFVLMEVNPKFWASYSLASRCGFHFAARLVERSLGMSFNMYPRKSQGTMVFPLREAGYVLKNRSNHGESFFSSASAMLWPPAWWDMTLREIWWSLPPLPEVFEKMRSLRRRHNPR